ncbi:MAG: hypothetical protein PHQ28_10825 [Mycobacterium sp.]|nr:hypothetical protein [Mycobacterium sp.]
MAVVIAVVDHGVLEPDIGELVALPPGFGAIGNGEIGDGLGAVAVVGHDRVETLDELQQQRVGSSRKASMGSTPRPSLPIRRAASR